MRPPGFWSQPPTHPLARLLAPAGRIYGARVAGRMDRRVTIRDGMIEQLA